jgi:hypothetical protein
MKDRGHHKEAEIPSSEAGPLIARPKREKSLGIPTQRFAFMKHFALIYVTLHDECEWKLQYRTQKTKCLIALNQ